MRTIRLTTAQALVRYLACQQIERDGERRRFFGGGGESAAVEPAPDAPAPAAPAAPAETVAPADKTDTTGA